MTLIQARVNTRLLTKAARFFTGALCGRIVEFCRMRGAPERSASPSPMVMESSSSGTMDEESTISRSAWIWADPAGRHAWTRAKIQLASGFFAWCRAH
jgi:hypothetical protein